MLLNGCGTTVELTEYKRLINHPQFPAAVNAAPEFVEDCLITINKWEWEAKRKHE